MVKVISFNVNGIRAAMRKNIWCYLAEEDPDFICFQELKAQEHNLTEQEKNPLGLYYQWHCAQKKGYSGVAIYSKHKPQQIQLGVGYEEIDNEGRFVQFDYKNFCLISLYLPSGSFSAQRQQVKFRVMELLFPLLKTLLNHDKPTLICGDWNIAHQEIDLKNWQANQTHSGFLPEERKWLSQILQSGGNDIWRFLYPKIPGYTWWSQRGRAYANDVGWRIDYHIANKILSQYAKQAHVYRGNKFSDHAPLVVDYELEINNDGNKSKNSL